MYSLRKSLNRFLVICCWATKETRINELPQNTIWKPFSDTILRSSVVKNQAKFKNECILRNGHRINITQPNLMIVVSFSSAEDVLSNDVKKCNTFSSQGTENLPFRVFGTPGIYLQSES